MKTYQRLFLFLLASLAITVLLSPWLAVSWDRFVSTRPDWEPYRYPFSRIFDRCFLITSILLFFPCRRFLKIGSASQIGLAPRTHAARDLALGFCCAVASMALLLALMSFRGAYTPFFRLGFADSMSRIANGILSGFSVALLEETFFRGIFFKAIFEQGKRVRAFLVANFFYAAVHFVKPENNFQLYGYDPWGGLRYLVASFKPFLNLPEVFPGLIGLFLIGLVLSYAVVRGNTLFLAMGLHAGWVFSIKTVRVFGDYTRQGLGWMFGSTDPKIVSGVISWVGILSVAIAVHVLTRRRAQKAET
ncbi:MAG: CPBP family intramembrane glutamic endopeptidase [Deltaproteobacteria bacterium]